MEKQPLLDGDKPPTYRQDATKPSDQTQKDGPTLRPWQRWEKKQVAPALVLLAGGFIGMMASKTVGPSLLDLQIRTGSSIEQVSWFNSAKAIGSMIGALVLGKFIDRSSRWLQLSVTMLLMGLVFSAIPWFTQFWAQLIFFVLYGLGAGYALTGGQLTVYCLFDNHIDSISWQNAYQMTMTIGGLFGPLVAQPFLLEMSTHNSSDSVNGTELIRPPGPDIVNIMFAFLIPGCLLVLVALTAFSLQIALGRITVKPRANKGHEIDSPNVQFPRWLKAWKAVLVVLLTIYYICQSVFLRTFNVYLVPFTTNGLGWTKAQGANLSTAYFSSAMVGKLFSIIFIRRLSVEVMLNSGLVICNVSAVALAFLLDVHSSIIWVFPILLSFGTSILVSVLLAWTDKHIGIKGFVGIIYSAAGSVGEIVFNPVIGYLFENVSYISLMYLVLASTAACFVLMIILQILGKQYVRAVEAFKK